MRGAACLRGLYGLKYLSYKLQQMVVGFFEVGFYLNSTFKQLPSATPSMQISGKSVKMNKGRLTGLCFAASREGL